MSMVWLIALVVLSNIIYQICTKSVAKKMDVVASMTVTYFVGAVCSAIMFFLLNGNASLLQEYRKMNLASVFLATMPSAMSLNPQIRYNA